MRSLKELFERALKEYECECIRMDSFNFPPHKTPYLCVLVCDLYATGHITETELDFLYETIQTWIEGDVSLRMHLKHKKLPAERKDCLNFYKNKMEELNSPINVGVNENER